MRWQILKNPSKSAEISALNAALTRCNENYSMEHITEIIQICEEFIQTIPLSERRKTPTQNWDALKTKYPVLPAVLEIQKTAVNFSFLPPEAKSHVQGIWAFWRSFFKSDQKNPGKKLDLGRDLIYLREYRYKGKHRIHQWINENIEMINEIRSHNEVLTQNLEGDVDYLKDPAKYKVQIKRKLLYFNGELLDTRSSKIREWRESVIFVVSREGDIYVSNPKEPFNRKFYHSVFLAGNSAMCMGVIKVVDGNIKNIALASGHYKPGRKELIAFLTLLRDVHEIDLTYIAVDDWQWRRNGKKYTHSKIKAILAKGDKFQNAITYLMANSDDRRPSQSMMDGDELSHDKEAMELKLGTIEYFDDPDDQENLGALYIAPFTLDATATPPVVYNVDTADGKRAGSLAHLPLTAEVTTREKFKLKIAHVQMNYHPVYLVDELPQHNHPQIVEDEQDRVSYIVRNQPGLFQYHHGVLKKILDRDVLIKLFGVRYFDHFKVETASGKKMPILMGTQSQECIQLQHEINRHGGYPIERHSKFSHLTFLFKQTLPSKEAKIPVTPEEKLPMLVQSPQLPESTIPATPSPKLTAIATPPPAISQNNNNPTVPENLDLSPSKC